MGKYFYTFTITQDENSTASSTNTVLQKTNNTSKIKCLCIVKFKYISVKKCFLISDIHTVAVILNFIVRTKIDNKAPTEQNLSIFW